MNHSRMWICALLLMTAVVFVIRITGPADLEGYAQSRNIGYLIDLVERDQWLAQRDIEGRIISKPPLHTWLIAPFALTIGINRLALVLPSLLAVVALSLLVFHIGRQRFGIIAGGFAGLSVVLAPMFSKHMAMVRSDAVFSLCIAAAAWAAYLAWTRGRSWTWFWAFATLATLTKGPLGILIAASGLLAYFWEKRSTPDLSRPRGSHLPGLVLFVVVCCGWFAAAVWVHGQELVDKLILDELLGQATGANKDSFPGANLPEPTLNLLGRFVPFSILGFIGAWRVFRRPSIDPEERLFERFLICWIAPGLVIFSLAAHHRADLLLPLWAPLGLLAGRTARDLLERTGVRTFSRYGVAIGVILLGYAYYTYHPTGGKRGRETRYSEDIRYAAMEFRKTGIPIDDLAYIDTPTTFQMYLGTARIWDGVEGIRALAEAGNPPRYIGTESDEVIAEDIGAASVAEIFRWPVNPEREAVTRVFEVRW